MEIRELESFGLGKMTSRTTFFGSFERGPSTRNKKTHARPRRNRGVLAAL